MVTPSAWIARIVATSVAAFALGQAAGDLVEQQQLAARSASARASSSRLRSSRVSVPATAVGLGGEAGALEHVGAVRRTISRSRRPRPKAAADERFSNTVRPSKGCGIWKRPADAHAAARSRRRRGSRRGRRSAMRAGIGQARSPVIRLNSVDLPAPFGPMMPSASPRATAKVDAVGDHQGAEALRDVFESEYRASRHARMCGKPGQNQGAGPGTRRMPVGRILASGSILPPVGISGACLLSTTTSSKPPSSFRATGRRPAASCRRSSRGLRRPTRPGRPSCRVSVAAMASPIASASVESAARLSTSTATSNSECEADRLGPRPPGRGGEAGGEVAPQLWPVRADLNGWVGDHQTSDESCCRRRPALRPTAGNRIALATVTALGLKPCCRPGSRRW